ncbi:tyrosine-type recombinase/integrase [Marinihelvus fidelis]|nr:tyrosine-type recombinase/integrase [Marinihelvus fidelis]
MPVGRNRKHDKGLPKRVYLRSGTYWYVDYKGKWHKLGRSEPDMHQALGKLLGEQLGTMKEYFDRYEREVLAKKAPRTRDDQTSQLKYLRLAFEHMAPSEIMRRDVAGYLDSYPAPVQANRHIALLSHVFTKLIRWQVVEENPCTGVEKNKERPRSRYISDEEFWAVHQRATEPVQLLMELALCTGQRRGDLIRLQWSQLDDEGIHFTQSKTGKVLVVLWSPMLRDVIRRCRKGTGGLYVIRKANGRPYTSDGISSAWQRLMNAWKGERFTFHDIRAKSGSDHETGEHLGHASKATLQRIYRRRPKVVKGL